MGKRDPNRQAMWRETISSWEGSGRTIKEFCAEHGLTAISFY